MRNLFLVLSISLLGACANVVDTQIPLDASFIDSSDKITLKQPGFTFRDSAYNMALLEYQVMESNISWQTEKSDLTDIRRENSSILEYLLFDDDLSYVVEEYEVNTFQKFSFSLNKFNERKSKSACQIFSQSLSDQTHDHHGHNEEFATRLQTYFVCKIEQEQKIMKFSLLAEADGRMEIQISGTNKPYSIKFIKDQYLLVKGDKGLEHREVPPWAQTLSGMMISSDGKQLAAASLVGDAKIWLAKALDAPTRELLLTIAYSTTLFNWLDSDWKKMGH